MYWVIVMLILSVLEFPVMGIYKMLFGQVAGNITKNIREKLYK